MKLDGHRVFGQCMILKAMAAAMFGLIKVFYDCKGIHRKFSPAESSMIREDGLHEEHDLDFHGGIKGLVWSILQYHFRRT